MNNIFLYNKQELYKYSNDNNELMNNNKFFFAITKNYKFFKTSMRKG